MRGLRRRHLLLGPLAAALGGCGFALRQPPKFAFRSVYLDVAPTSPFGAELRRQLAVSEVELITDAAQRARAQVWLDILDERRVKTVVGVSATGQVREFQLRLHLRFRLRTPQGKELIPETELVQQRALTFEEALALAKEAEEAMLYRNMQSDMVQLILRRLAAVQSL
ncbi:MAG: LPS assembly lipoprotein LptE [Hylemonella sp.]